VKRLIPLIAVVFCIAAPPMFALDTPDRNDRAAAADRDRDRNTIIDDVVRMSNAGVSDDAIVKFVRQSRERYVMNADTIIQLTDAKVSKGVIDALLDDSDNRGNEGRYSGTDRRTTVYVAPAYGYGYGYGYPYGYYDPWFSPYWYGPRIGFSIGFGRSWGGYYGRGGHYRGHR
jgi:hypothetical protein